MHGPPQGTFAASCFPPHTTPLSITLQRWGKGLWRRRRIISSTDLWERSKWILHYTPQSKHPLQTGWGMRSVLAGPPNSHPLSQVLGVSITARQPSMLNVVFLWLLLPAHILEKPQQRVILQPKPSSFPLGDEEGARVYEATEDLVEENLTTGNYLLCTKCTNHTHLQQCFLELEGKAQDYSLPYSSC